MKGVSIMLIKCVGGYVGGNVGGYVGGYRI